jgi:hypothetical protein
MKRAVATLTILMTVLGIAGRVDAQGEPKPGPWGAKNEAKVTKSIERALATQRTDALLGGFGSPRIRHNLARCTVAVLEAEHLPARLFTSQPPGKLVASLEAATAGDVDSTQRKVLMSGQICLNAVAPAGAGLGYFEVHDGIDDGRIAAFFETRNASGCPNGRAANGACNGQG